MSHTVLVPCYEYLNALGGQLPCISGRSGTVRDGCECGPVMGWCKASLHLDVQPLRHLGHFCASLATSQGHQHDVLQTDAILLAVDLVGTEGELLLPDCYLLQCIINAQMIKFGDIWYTLSTGP